MRLWCGEKNLWTFALQGKQVQAEQHLCLLIVLLGVQIIKSALKLFLWTKALVQGNKGRQQLLVMNICTYNPNSTLQENVKLFEQIVNIPVFCFGVIFNVFAFWVFCFKLEKWTETRVYMINLVIADCSLLFTLPFVMYFQWNDYPIDNLCLAIQTIFFTNTPMSISIITIIAVDRYVAIKYPLKATTLRSPLRSAALCAVLWIIMAIYAYFNPRFQKGKEKFCFQKTSYEPLYIALFSSIVGYFIPLGILSFCSIQIISCLKKKINATPHEEKLTQKALYIVSVNLSVFIICFLPFNIGLLLSFAVDVVGVVCNTRLKIRTFIRVAACVANINCCLDALCYYFVAKEFQEASAVFSVFKSLQFRTNQSQETEQVNM
ncbi:G-protein coupled receptor 35 isoform X1 [Alligator mississippiensis]|uniref:G-protein coupled receptor 35 isoform X1 n=2 Tax=Alligator mississippiensis TaxID=8496 RepID=UPI00090760C3|nr:G-protein coupled receptor 35 isoform X1 [Alligator mississippiensis]